MKTGFLAFLLLPVYAVAQTPGADTLAPVPAFFSKTNLTALLNPAKPAAAVALDVRLSRRFSADAGVGYILDAPAFADEKGESYRGLRLRAGGSTITGLLGYRRFPYRVGSEVPGGESLEQPKCPAPGRAIPGNP
ncbi:MAG: hypothetical protein IPI11_14765 [Haliscomenobacter sp.]|nr:hypothetical protein [Haliscomenobacter sp.]